MTAALPISVVVPAYNRPAMTRRAVLSAFAQRPAPPAEVLVVDDCSDDDTGEAARAVGARVIRHDVNQGEGAARNTALRHAAHDWIALLDSDDEWLPNHLDSLWGMRSGRVLLAGSALRLRPDGTHRLIGSVTDRGISIGSPADVASLRFIAASAVVIRRDIALAVGAFRPLAQAADLDLWLRILERGPGWVSPHVSVLYHEHAGQVSADGRGLLEAARSVLLDYSDRPWLTSRVLEQWDASVAWHDLRSAVAERDVPAALDRMTHLLSRPVRVMALGRILGWRWRERRRSARFTSEGRPSVAVLGRDAATNACVRERFTVEPRTTARLRPMAYWELVRQPAAVLMVENGLDAMVARALGMRPAHRA
jgi:hypothetical protein